MSDWILGKKIEPAPPEEQPEWRKHDTLKNIWVNTRTGAWKTEDPANELANQQPIWPNYGFFPTTEGTT